MRLAWIVFALLAQCKCNTPPPTPPKTADQIWTEITQAGCVSQDVNGPVAIQHELDAGSFTWLSCMETGGTVTSCNVPCGP